MTKVVKLFSKKGPFSNLPPPQKNEPELEEELDRIMNSGSIPVSSDPVMREAELVANQGTIADADLGKLGER